jgi:hypothetical protein
LIIYSNQLNPELLKIKVKDFCRTISKRTASWFFRRKSLKLITIVLNNKIEENSAITEGTGVSKYAAFLHRSLTHSATGSGISYNKL